MRNSGYVRLALYTVLLFQLCLSSTSCSRMFREPVSFSIGVNQSIKSAPVIIAEDQGYFKDEHLDVNITVESSAVSLMQGLFDNRYDLVCIPEYQAVAHGFARSDFRIIAVINRNQSRSLVMDGRTITGSAKLSGKRIGLAKNSAAEYTLYRILLFNRIKEEEVLIEYFSPDDLPQALASGKVDAVISWEPFTGQIEQLLKGFTIVENAHYGRDMYWLLVTRLTTSIEREDDLVRIIESLERATSFLNTRSDVALDIVSESLSLSRESLAKEWIEYSFFIELPQSLLLAMEQESSWYRSRRSVDFESPQYLEMIDDKPLARRYPRRVSIAGSGGVHAP